MKSSKASNPKQLSRFLTVNFVLILSRSQYSLLQPPNHKLPPELDVEKIVKELTIGEKGYVLLSGLFSQEEIDLAK